MQVNGLFFVLFIGVIGFFISGANAQQLSPGMNSRSFTYLNSTLTSASPTSSIIANAVNAQGIPKFYSMSVVGTASPFQVKLEGSLDANGLSGWTQIGSTTSATGIYSTTTASPMLYLRLRANVIPANATLTATAVGTW